MPVEYNDSQHYGIFLTNANKLDSSTTMRVRMSELVLAALRAQGVFDNMEDGTAAPATDKLWLDKNSDPAVFKEYDPTGAAWVPMTFERLFGRAIVTEMATPTGTGNAIVVAQPDPFIANRMYSLTPIADNSGAVTIQVTGVATYDAKYSDGSALDAKELRAGDPTILLFTGTRFEVLFKVADVFAARDQAVAAAAALPSIAANTMLVDNAAGDAREAKTFGVVRNRLGKYDTQADFAAVAAIPAGVNTVEIAGYYAVGDGGAHRKARLPAPVASKPWHTVLADGSMWEVDDAEYDTRHFGVSPTKTAAENSVLLQNAIDAASINLRKLHVRGDPIDCAGGLYFRSNLTMEWAPGAWLRQTQYSSTGAFFTNVSPVQAERAIRDVVLINPLIDLSAITYEAGDTTHSENCIGFARNAERIWITGGILKGAAPNFNAAGGWGGKAIGLDGGVRYFTMFGTRLESCLYGIWVRGNEHQFATTADGYERTTGVKFIGCHIEDMPLPIAIMGRDADEDPDYRMEDIAVQVIATTGHNIGFCPNTPASNTDRYKAGIINLGEAQSFLIDGFTGFNDNDYVTSKGGWPATGTVIGQGLSGAPCHIINGWGGGGTIRNIHFQGSVDYHWKCERAFPIGDDAASSDPAETRRVKVNYLLIDNIRHIGGCIGVFSQSDYYPVTTSSDIRARLDNIYPYALSGGIVASNASTLESMTIKVFQSATKWIEGTPKFLYGIVGNALSASDSQSWSENHRISKPQSYPIKTVANSATISFALSKLEGLIAFSCSASQGQGILKYRCSAGATQASIYGPASISNVAATTGASPAGTASTLTFSFDDSGNLWVNNQRGASLDLTFNQLA